MKTIEVPRAEGVLDEGRTASVVAVAGGSLPVSSVKRLIAKWESGAEDNNWNGHYRAAQLGCIADLRAEMDAVTVRQPEENAGDVARAGNGAAPK